MPEASEARDSGDVPAARTGGEPTGRPAGLSELVSRVVERGVVISGDLVLTVAGVDLVYVGLDVVLSSVETLERQRGELPDSDEE